MWFLPTYGRPDSIRAIEETYGGFPDYRDLILMLTEGDPSVERYMKYPYRKVICHARSLGDQLRWILPLFPEEETYGILTDDMRPRSPYWYDSLSDAAGDRLIALSSSPGSTASLPGVPCFGGGLIRAMGSVMPPTGVHHNSTDVVWREIGDMFSLITTITEAVIYEMHPIHGNAPMDDTYKRGAFNPEFKFADPLAHEKWKHSPDYAAMLGRIKTFIDG